MKDEQAPKLWVMFTVLPSRNDNKTAIAVLLSFNCNEQWQARITQKYAESLGEGLLT